MCPEELTVVPHHRASRKMLQIYYHVIAAPAAAEATGDETDRRCTEECVRARACI